MRAALIIVASFGLVTLLYGGAWLMPPGRQTLGIFGALVFITGAAVLFLDGVAALAYWLL